MKTIKLTPEQYRILTSPTRIEQYGAQQEVARNVQAQVMALSGKTTMIDAFDIAAINKAIEVNREGAFIATNMAGGWPTTEWSISIAKLKRAIQVSAS